MVERGNMSSFLLWFFSLILCIGLNTALHTDHVLHNFKTMPLIQPPAPRADPRSDITPASENIFLDGISIFSEPLVVVRVRRKISVAKKEAASRRNEANFHGNLAHSQSKSGKSQAAAFNSNGDAISKAINGSQADAFTLTTHERGQAVGLSDTHGEGGARTVSVALGKGNAIGNATSRGKARSKALTFAAQGGRAMSNSDSINGGNSTAYAISTGTGESESNAYSKGGSSNSASISKGTGDSNSNSMAEVDKGNSKSVAVSRGGDVEATSHLEGNGRSTSMGSTKGNGTSTSKAISTRGYSRADSYAQKGDSLATASNGSENESVVGVLGEFLKASESEGLDEEEHISQTHVAR